MFIKTMSKIYKNLNMLLCIFSSKGGAIFAPVASFFARSLVPSGGYESLFDYFSEEGLLPCMCCLKFIFL